MSPLTDTAAGMIVQLLFAVNAMVGSAGALKAGLPLVDHEGRDVEVHLGGAFKPAIAVQVKSSTVLVRRGRIRLLKMSFALPLKNQIDDPGFWYLFAYLDLTQIRLAEWVFLVPSAVVHARCGPAADDGDPHFYFQASIEADAQDQWTPYRLRPEALGARLLEIISSLPSPLIATGALAAIDRLPGLCLLGAGP